MIKKIGDQAGIGHASIAVCDFELLLGDVLNIKYKHGLRIAKQFSKMSQAVSTRFEEDDYS